MSEWAAAAESDGEGTGGMGGGEAMEEQMGFGSGGHMAAAAQPAAMCSEAAATQFPPAAPSPMWSNPPPAAMGGGPNLPAMGTAQGRGLVHAGTSATMFAWPPDGRNVATPPVWPFAALDMAGPLPSYLGAPPFSAAGRFAYPGAPPPFPGCNFSSESEWSDLDDLEDDDEEEAEHLFNTTNTDQEEAFVILMSARLRHLQASLAASYAWGRNVASRPTHWGGSVPRRRVVHRDNAEGEASLMRDYFGENPIFNETIFRRRFRMSQNLFIRIADAVIASDDYFVQKYNAALKKGLHPYQKITAALRMLAYGGPADRIDEYLRIAKSTVWEATRAFAYAIVKVFGKTYLRAPTHEDINRLLEMHASRGFPGMIGSLDCMHWKWRSCPAARKGVYSGRSKAPTLILEAVASYDGWIWHSFFGTAGSNNDINVLQRSHLFHSVIRGDAPPVNFSINGHEYDMGYYLVDGIYPELSTFVKKIAIPITPKDKNFTKAQESCRKDIERAFGMLQARWSITCQPARAWDTKTLKMLMRAAIIMHNMIIEDEGGLQPGPPDFEMMDTSPEPVHADTPELLAARRVVCDTIEDESLHMQLHDDLVEHLWQLRMIEMM